MFKQTSTRVLSVLLVISVAFLVASYSLYLNKQDSQEEPIRDLLVSHYCQDFFSPLGFNPQSINGIILSDRYSEEELENARGHLPLRVSGEFAYATIDCEDQEGPMGMLRNILLRNTDNAWKVIDETQTGLNRVFSCSVLEENNVPTEFVSRCKAPNDVDIIDR